MTDHEHPDDLTAYDAGCLNDFGGGDVDWWQDYIRAELGRADDHYRAQLDTLTARIAAAEAERDEADRRAGAAEREMERLKESARRRNGWLSRAKQERGYDDTASFDVVWKETCEKADKATAAEAAAYRKAAEWRTDMENAPRDGTDIYLGAAPQTYMGEAVPARSTIGHWATDEECRTYTGDCGGECRCPEYEYVEPNWISWDGGFTNENPPTHWREIMPTPDADAILALSDTSALDEALAAEREKCAQMRPDLYAIYGADRTDSFAKGFCSGVEAYAAAIRKGDQA